MSGKLAITGVALGGSLSLLTGFNAGAQAQGAPEAYTASGQIRLDAGHST